MTHDDYADWDAAYVLGALSVSDRHEYERHLPGCGSCRRAVGELAQIPGLLGALPALPARREGFEGEQADAVASDPASLAVLADRVRRRRRRGRMLLAAAAVALLSAGGAAGYAVTQSLGIPPVSVGAGEALRLDPVAGSEVQADVVLTEKASGTRLDWSCSYPYAVDPTHAYELAVIDATGLRTVVATWTGDGTPRTSGLSATTATRLAEIERVELSAAPSGALLAGAEH